MFNCGIGMAVVVADVDAATELLRDQGESVARIGHIEAAGGPSRVCGWSCPLAGQGEIKRHHRPGVAGIWRAVRLMARRVPARLCGVGRAVMTGAGPATTVEVVRGGGKRRAAVMISGRGSNMAALIAAAARLRHIRRRSCW